MVILGYFLVRLLFLSRSGMTGPTQGRLPEGELPISGSPSEGLVKRLLGDGVYCSILACVGDRIIARVNDLYPFGGS